MQHEVDKQIDKTQALWLSPSVLPALLGIMTSIAAMGNSKINNHILSNIYEGCLDSFLID